MTAAPYEVAKVLTRILIAEHGMNDTVAARVEVRNYVINFMRDAIREAYMDAAHIAEECEVCLEPDDMFGNKQIAAAIRSRISEGT